MTSSAYWEMPITPRRCPGSTSTHSSAPAAPEHTRRAPETLACLQIIAHAVATFIFASHFFAYLCLPARDSCLFHFSRICRRRCCGATTLAAPPATTATFSVDTTATRTACSWKYDLLRHRAYALAHRGAHPRCLISPRIASLARYLSLLGYWRTFHMAIMHSLRLMPQAEALAYRGAAAGCQRAFGASGATNALFDQVGTRGWRWYAPACAWKAAGAHHARHLGRYGRRSRVSPGVAGNASGKRCSMARRYFCASLTACARTPQGRTEEALRTIAPCGSACLLPACGSTLSSASALKHARTHLLPLALAHLGGREAPLRLKPAAVIFPLRDARLRLALCAHSLRHASTSLYRSCLFSRPASAQRRRFLRTRRITARAIFILRCAPGNRRNGARMLLINVPYQKHSHGGKYRQLRSLCGSCAARISTAESWPSAFSRGVAAPQRAIAR